jgi:hypothetical protein
MTTFTIFAGLILNLIAIHQTVGSSVQNTFLVILIWLTILACVLFYKMYTENESLQKENQHMKRAFTYLAQHHRPSSSGPYDYEVIYEVKSNGDVLCTTKLKRQCTESVSWYCHTLGICDPKPSKPLWNLIREQKITACDMAQRPLQLISIVDKEQDKRILVIYEKRYKAGDTFQLRIQEECSSWASLIKNLEGNGKVIIRPDMTRYSLSIVVPSQLRIYSFTETPSVGDYKLEDDGTKLTWTADAPPKGLYEYTIKCTRLGET